MKDQQGMAHCRFRRKRRVSSLCSLNQLALSPEAASILSGTVQPYYAASSEHSTAENGNSAVQERAALSSPDTSFAENANLTDQYSPSEPASYTGPWGGFRRLMRYYRQCLRAEGGAEPAAYQNQHGEHYIYLGGEGFKLPGLRSWQYQIPLTTANAQLVRSLPPPNSADALVLGYPLVVVHRKKEDEPDTTLLAPVFFYFVSYTVDSSGLTLKLESPAPEVNSKCLAALFKNAQDAQRNFLSACGITLSSEDYSGNDTSKSTPCSSMVALLEQFLPQLCTEALLPNHIPVTPLHPPFSSGIFNKCVPMRASRTPFMEKLLSELHCIEEAPDDMLDRTALAHLFRQQPESAAPLVDAVRHEKYVPEFWPLNVEQRKAVTALLTRPVSVVTGPPGTGKSQVVATVIAAARLHEQTVLFASQNHKAIDAVVDRCVDANGRPLLVRCNAKTDPNLKYTFDKAIAEMLAAQSSDDAIEASAHVTATLHRILKQRAAKAEEVERVLLAAEALGQFEECCIRLTSQLPEGLPEKLECLVPQYPLTDAETFLALAKSVSETNADGWLMWWQAWWRCAKVWRQLRRNQSGFDFAQPPPLPLWPSVWAVRACNEAMPLLETGTRFIRTRKEILHIEAALRTLPSAAKLTTDMVELNGFLEKHSTKALILDMDRREGVPAENSRENLSTLRNALRTLRSGLDGNALHATLKEHLHGSLPAILHARPCWAVTSLSAGSRIPLVPGLFDVVLIDEASQSAIPTAIPLLFRARRVGVVGDPHQLSHISKILPQREALFRKESRLSHKEIRFTYPGNSLYDLVAGTDGCTPVLLSETFRSTEAIAEYSNQLFYGGKLRVGTRPETLISPSGMRPGIHWTPVHGEVLRAPGSGCLCPAEVEAVVQLLRTLLGENAFKGTVGVVTPFRQQANRLQDAIFDHADAVFFRQIEHARCLVDTAHGFQGDERDVMIFSLCAGGDMPRGSLSFLRDTGNLFNVAVSRARAVLHIVGNQVWARQCGIPHIAKLAAPRRETSGFDAPPTPWHPHESPWEQILFNALVKEGLEPRAQFKAGSRRLDMALISETQGIKLDIEVDGDCHRNPDGSRKTDDVWRDIQLQGMGWTVLRFWTYQLREDLNGCVETIKTAWRKHEPR